MTKTTWRKIRKKFRKIFECVRSIKKNFCFDFPSRVVENALFDEEVIIFTIRLCMTFLQLTINDCFYLLYTC